VRLPTTLALALAAITAISLAACSGGASPASSTAAASEAASEAAGACEPSTNAATVNVTIKDLKFSPEPIAAKVGDVIAWKNDDSTSHTATLDAGECDAGSISAGATAALAFNVAGTYAYHCAIHPSMKGTIQVG